jgi:ubiquinone/menaquinone biosynthesis C-methylase UbiE
MEGLPFAENEFHFVHMRDMQSAITTPWDSLLTEINRILIPGGYVQFAEFIYEHSQNTVNPYKMRAFRNSPVKQMENRFIKVGSKPWTKLITGGRADGENGV